MKKYLLILLSVVFLISCGGNKPVETIISKNDVDLTGNAFQSFRLGGDIHLLMTPNTEDASKWMIRATAPIQKIDNTQIEEMTADIHLLDANGTKAREGFILAANDLVSIIPVLNAAANTEKNIVFSAGEGMKKDFSYKEAVQLLNSVKKISLTLNAKKAVEKSVETVVEEVVSDTPEAATENNQIEEKKPTTFNELMKYYGIYGKLALYEKHLRNKDKKKAKQVEDQLYSIEKKVKSDASIPKSVRDRFVDYIENKEDEIEDRY